VLVVVLPQSVSKVALLWLLLAAAVAEVLLVLLPISMLQAVLAVTPWMALNSSLQT